MPSQDIMSWYEASLPVQERKRRGHFSTPPLLIERILDACGYSVEKDLSQLRVLDPACGSGNFLAGAASRLLASEQQRNLPRCEQIASLQRNIWGFDPDPVACFLAEMQVRSLVSAEDQEEPAAPPLHIHQADGLAFPWEQHENVDLFLANPPYLAAKNTDLSGYQFARQRGQTDSYLLFLSLALQIVRPGGWIGLVVPDPVLARTNARPERQRLLAETTLHHLWHFSGVFSAYVGAAVIIAQKSPPRPIHHVAWQREAWPRLSQAVAKPAAQLLEHCATPAGARSVPQSLLRNQPGAEMRYLLSGTRNSLVERLHAFHYTLQGARERPFLPLGELVIIRRGEELSKNSTYLFKTQPLDGQSWYPVLRGGSAVRPYMPPSADSWIAREHIVKSMERYLAPKLLVVKSTNRLQATLDLRSHIV
ncbi:MAG TPA: N-6 DNA methylase, partial [Ktedonobacteraceae bacterium]|nr:N-6 DNA methylase [Ktedonobacteraceae bacterium]